MELPEITCREDMAVDIVVSILNKSMEKLGVRQNLFQIANSRKFVKQAIVPLGRLKPPLAITSEELINDCIEKNWHLHTVFQYHVRYLEISADECAQYYYFEAIFSQPNVTYPIPQVTASVFFRVENKHIEPVEHKPIPLMIFRLEGHFSSHDVRYVKVIPDWLLGIMHMKLKVFQRIEDMKLF